MTRAIYRSEKIMIIGQMIMII